MRKEIKKIFHLFSYIFYSRFFGLDFDMLVQWNQRQIGAFERWNNFCWTVFWIWKSGQAVKLSFIGVDWLIFLLWMRTKRIASIKPSKMHFWHFPRAFIEWNDFVDFLRGEKKGKSHNGKAFYRKNLERKQKSPVSSSQFERIFIKKSKTQFSKHGNHFY